MRTWGRDGICGDEMCESRMCESRMCGNGMRGSEMCVGMCGMECGWRVVLMKVGMNEERK